MIKKTITYTDYNGEERTEDFYFNLTRAEILEMELGTSGGMANMLQRIVSSRDTTEIIKIFKEIIMKAYGEKSPDGKRFIKRDKDGNRLADSFAETEAFSQLFMELAFDSDSASAFVRGIVPEDMPKGTVAPLEALKP